MTEVAVGVTSGSEHPVTGTADSDDLMAFCIKDYSVLEKYTTQEGRAAGQGGPVTAVAREAFFISMVVRFHPFCG